LGVTIDERLEKLTERHEALTQSVELMVAENRERDKRMAQTDKRLIEIMEGIARLLHIAEIHEQRLDDLENRP
jgi:hypothetical protein